MILLQIRRHLSKSDESGPRDKRESERASSTTPSSVIGSASSICSASLGTHCTCKRHLPTSHGIAIAEVVYPSTALVTSVLTSRPRSSPPASASPGESSKMEFCTGREEKVWEVIVECWGGGTPGGRPVEFEGGVNIHVCKFVL